MIIGGDRVVMLTYELVDAEGNVLEQAQDPIAYLHGGHSGMFPLVEQALTGRKAGEGVTVRLQPGDAFGDYDDDLVRTEPRAAFPANIEVGMRFEGTGAESGAMRVYTVTSVSGDQVEVDGNHPYAGMTLEFRCKVVSVRKATREELEHGHVHGAGGHHH